MNRRKSIVQDNIKEQDVYYNRNDINVYEEYNYAEVNENVYEQINYGNLDNNLYLEID